MDPTKVQKVICDTLRNKVEQHVRQCQVFAIESCGVDALDTLMDLIDLQRSRPAELLFLSEFIGVRK
jgi:hypothetical protein